MWLKPDGTHKIKHIIVLVMENRSYEHIFGMSNIKGTGICQNNEIILDNVVPHISSVDGARVILNDSIIGIPQEHQHLVTCPAPDRMLFDPEHELEGTRTQLRGFDKLLDPEAFVDSALESKTVNNVHELCPNEPIVKARDVLKVCSREQVPILVELAENFVVCDNWRSSVPSSTTANRLFFHAASSGGLITSPTAEKVLEDCKDSPLMGYRLNTIFDKLEQNNNTWRVYHGDNLPNVALIHGLADNLLLSKTFASYGQWNGSTQYSHGKFYKHCMNRTLPDYSFIEPCYGDMSTFTQGNSMHPIGSITHGESLIKNVYETLRNSPSWQDSLLIITFDEAGGFYSSYRGEPVVPTGDDERYNILGFDFKTPGMKVPALVISPWVGKNIIDHRSYEHSSVPKTIEDRFGLSPMTQRDKIAKSLGDLLMMEELRQDCPLQLSEQTVMDVQEKTIVSSFDNSFVRFIVEGLK
jgi:phospholipase C